MFRNVSGDRNGRRCFHFRFDSVRKWKTTRVDRIDPAGGACSTVSLHQHTERPTTQHPDDNYIGRGQSVERLIIFPILISIF